MFLRAVANPLAVQRDALEALFDACVGLAPALVLLTPTGHEVVGEAIGWLAFPVGLAAAAAVAMAQYRSDRNAWPAWVDDLADSPVAVVGIALTILVSLLAVFARWPDAASPWVLTVAAGGGLGYAAYRVVFGVLRPLPAPASARQSDEGR